MALDDLDSAINIATGEVTKNDDPLSRLDSAIDNVVTTQKKRAATVTGIATKFNPDQIAQSRALGRQVGLPDDIAERNPDEVRRRFITQKVSELYDTSPVLGRKLSDPAFAKLSHDITDELAGQESAIKQLALTKQGFREASELSRAMSDQQFSNIIERGRDRVVERGIGDVVGSFGRSIAAGSTGRIGQGVYGTLASPFGVLSPLLDPLVGTVLPANPLRVAEQGLLNLSKQQSNVADAIAGDRSEQGFVEGAVNSGFESLGMNLPPLLAGVISNNPSLALNAMVSLTGGQEFAKAREQGLGANQALTYAGSQLGVEYFTEKLPVDTLFKGLRGETGLLKTLLLSNVQEQIGEQAATVLQDLNEWAVLNPDKPFAEYVKERPDAALQTAIATLVGTTGQVAIAKSIEVAGNYVSTEQEKLQYQSEAANTSMEAFANIQQLAAQSKLKQRSAQDFATFLQEAGGENGLDEVYIDARTFVEEAEKQGVDLNTLMQSSPVINQQLQEAIAQGVDLVIPVGEFGASIAGTEFGGAILQHLRADENGISAFEAKTQLDDAVNELQKQAETIAQQYQDNEAWQQSVTEVSDNLLGQLNAVGRFTPESNQAYVQGLVAPWYSTLASNLGITPAEAYARYPLQVSGNVTANGFEQNDIVGKNEALSSLSKLSQVVYDETYTPQDAYDALYEAANPKQKTVLRALSKEQMLGFEYPHQALDELRRNPEAYQTSPAFKGILTKAGNNQFNQNNVSISALTELSKKYDMEVDNAENPYTKDIGQPSLIKFNDAYVQLSVKEDSENIYVTNIHTKKVDDLTVQAKGTGRGTDVLNSLKEYSDLTGKKLAIVDAVESATSYYEKLQYLKRESVTLEFEGEPYTPLYSYTYTPKSNNLNQSESQIDTPEFKAWFGDSKVVDADGKPLVVYHGSPDMRFMNEDAVFKSQKDRLGFGENKGAHWFTPSRQTALTYADPRRAFDYQRAEEGVIPAYLKMQNPLIVEANGANWRDAQRRGKTGEVIEVARSNGHDGVIIRNVKDDYNNGIGTRPTDTYVVFESTQIKSAIGNRGTFDPNDANILNQQARGQISFSNDITQGANITLLKNADASTFIHELGHFFLEVYADVASKPDAPQVIVDDMNQLFNWFGIESTEQPAIDVWRNMTLDQKRPYHEQLARGFEQYAMEGKAPTLELSRVFAKLRSFMLSAYKSLKQFFERSGDPSLTPEVRQVFDRMLASDDAINKAEAVRGMMPMFASMEEAGMSVDEYAEYLQNQQDATDEAKTQLTARSLRDMKWLQGARSRVLRDLQRQADAERRAVRMAVRREVMTQPVYQAYSWLKQIPDESKAQQAEKVKATKGVDVEKDSLYTAIAKLGGLNRELAASEWGIDPKDKFDSGVFGKPVLRKEGGLSPDAMAEALAQYEYLTLDENGKWDLREFEDKFFEEAKGERQYSLFAEGEQYRKWQESIYDEQERVRLDAFGKGKLDLNSMKAMYGEDGDWRNLGIGRTGMVMQTGNPPDAVAELFGFNSGDHLVKSLLAAENPKALVERLTNERMLAEFGDLVDAKKMNEAADKAVHNEVRARVLATELSAQNKALGNRRILEAAAKEYANRQIAGTLVRDLKSSKFTRAESKSAKMADKATRKGDTQTAVQAKRDQLLNNRAAKATLDANDKVDATLKYFKKFDSEGVRKNLDIEYIEQIDDILMRFDLRSGQSLRAINKRKSLVQWVEGQKEIGLSPVIDEDLLNEARRTSYKDLPFEQFMALADSIRNIEHLGRLKKTLLTAKDKREFAERMTEARESINNNGNRIVPERATPNDFIGKTARFGRRFSAAHRKFSSFMRELDGGKDLGVMQDMLLYSMYEAGSLETDLRAKATDDMQRLFATIEGTLDKAVGNLYAIKRIVPGTNISLTHEQRIMFAMNWGNDGNRQRLLDGGLEGTRSISNEDASAILDTITKDEWDFIQGTWDYIATFKPMIAEQERKLTGREPVWIDPSPVNTKYGTYAGGYFPAKYDAQMSTRSESLEAVTDLRMAMKGAFNSSGTRDGYTQARAEAVKGRPILLSFDTISRHIHEVTHRLAWQEWLTDATRVVTALDGSIRERLGAEALQEIHQHIRDVAIGDAPVTGTTDVLLSRIRTGTSIVGMGYRVSTALLQPSGIFQSWGRLGIGAVANGIKTVLKNPVKTNEWVMENSPMMRNRARTLNREINEIVNQVRAGKNLTTLQASYFYMISKMQIMIDMPTYVGAYEKALADLDYDQAGSEDERKAIENKAHSFAGQTVIDTQTGGEIKDLAGVQKGGQGQKLFTNFYSYFSALYNLNVENFRTKKLTNPAEFADFVATAILLNVMPVIYSVILKNLLKGECAWDDTECILNRYKSEQMSAIFGQMIGLRDVGVAVDVATGGDAFGYSGPPSLRFFADVYKLGQQAEQGEVDMPLFKSLNNAGGILFHYPAGQINTTVDGMLAIERGEVEGVSIFNALISGPPKD